MLAASKFNKTWSSIVFSKRGLSESAVILVPMPTGMGETLHHFPRNAESFRIKWRAFRLFPPDGGLLVHYCRNLHSFFRSIIKPSFVH